MVPRHDVQTQSHPECGAQGSVLSPSAPALPWIPFTNGTQPYCFACGNTPLTQGWAAKGLSLEPKWPRTPPVHSLIHSTHPHPPSPTHSCTSCPRDSCHFLDTSATMTGCTVVKCSHATSVTPKITSAVVLSAKSEIVPVLTCLSGRVTLGVIHLIDVHDYCVRSSQSLNVRHIGLTSTSSCTAGGSMISRVVYPTTGWSCREMLL